MAIDYATSFFKLILTPLHLHMLAIPKEFMKKHGNNLSDPISLHIPCTGAMSKVKLIRSENGEEAYFSKGWPEFVELYSISIGYFVMFTYKGSSQFDVFIMDMSACEIEYPVVAVNTKPADTFMANLKRAKREKVDCSKIPAAGGSSKKAKVEAAPKKVYYSRSGLTSAEKKMAEAYRTCGPSFVVKIVPTHVKYMYKMTIPAAFVRAHLHKEKKIISINLCSENNKGKKTWSVKCEVKRKGKRYERLLTKGWSNFAMDNELREGDICIWEMVKARTFKMSILSRAWEMNANENCCPAARIKSENDSD